MSGNTAVYAKRIAEWVNTHNSPFRNVDGTVDPKLIVWLRKHLSSRAGFIDLAYRCNPNSVGTLRWYTEDNVSKLLTLTYKRLIELNWRWVGFIPRCCRYDYDNTDWGMVVAFDRAVAILHSERVKAGIRWERMGKRLNRISHA